MDIIWYLYPVAEEVVRGADQSKESQGAGGLGGAGPKNLLVFILSESSPDLRFEVKISTDQSLVYLQSIFF